MKTFDFVYNKEPSLGGRKAHFQPVPTVPYDVSKRSMSYGEVVYHLSKHRGLVRLYFYGMNILEDFDSPKGAVFSMGGTFARDHISRFVEENKDVADFYCFKGDDIMHVYAVKARHAARIVGQIETPTEKPRTTQSQQGATPKNHANMAPEPQTDLEKYHAWLRSQYDTDEDFADAYFAHITYWMTDGEFLNGKDFTKHPPVGDFTQEQHDEAVAKGHERRKSLLGDRTYNKEQGIEVLKKLPRCPSQAEMDKMTDEEQELVLQRISEGYYDPDTV